MTDLPASFAEIGIRANSYAAAKHVRAAKRQVRIAQRHPLPLKSQRALARAIDALTVGLAYLAEIDRLEDRADVKRIELIGKVDRIIRRVDHGLEAIGENE